MYELISLSAIARHTSHPPQPQLDGTLQPGIRIVEATSGNTGIALAAIGRSLGHSVTIIMPDWPSKERIDIIRISCVYLSIHSLHAIWITLPVVG
jgi:threonine synthase